MNPRLAFIKWISCLDFCKFLAFEEKLEVTMPKPIQACLLAADSWYKLPDICGYCLQQKIRSMAQDLQSCKKHALSKWYYELYAIFGLIHCAMLQKSEQDHYPLSLHLIMECRRD